MLEVVGAGYLRMKNANKGGCCGQVYQGGVNHCLKCWCSRCDVVEDWLDSLVGSRWGGGDGSLWSFVKPRSILFWLVVVFFLQWISQGIICGEV